MSKTIIVAGFGPGISSSVAEEFGQRGFNVALVARNQATLEQGVAKLSSKNIKAQAFTADLGDHDAAQKMVRDVRAALGPITVVHWNAAARVAGDVMTASPAELRAAYELSVVSLIAVLQEALPDLKQHKGSFLITNGGLGLFEPQIDLMAVKGSVMGLAISNSAKHKLSALLHERLRPEGVYVGELMVKGIVKGSASDRGNGTLEPHAIAARFFELHQARVKAHDSF